MNSDVLVRTLLEDDFDAACGPGEERVNESDEMGAVGDFEFSPKTDLLSMSGPAAPTRVDVYFENGKRSRLDDVAGEAFWSHVIRTGDFQRNARNTATFVDLRHIAGKEESGRAKLKLLLPDLDPQTVCMFRATVSNRFLNVLGLGESRQARSLLEDDLDDFELDVKADLLGWKADAVWASVALRFNPDRFDHAPVHCREDALEWWSALPAEILNEATHSRNFTVVTLYRNRKPPDALHGLPVSGAQFNRLAKSLVFSENARPLIEKANELVVASLTEKLEAQGINPH